MGWEIIGRLNVDRTDKERRDGSGYRVGKRGGVNTLRLEVTSLSCIDFVDGLDDCFMCV